MTLFAAKVECLPRSGIRQPLIQAFMDDLTVHSNISARMPLPPQRSGKAGNMGENDIQASQMQVPGPEEGGVEGKFCFHLDGLPILSVSEKPVKSLGKIFNATLRETAMIHSTHIELKTWL